MEQLNEVKILGKDINNSKESLERKKKKNLIKYFLGIRAAERQKKLVKRH